MTTPGVLHYLQICEPDSNIPVGKLLFMSMSFLF
jgi:hypothetical protein